MITDALFNAAQEKLFALLFLNVDEAFHMNDIIRRTGLGSATTQRELKRLTTAGIVISSRVGNVRQFRANKQCPIFHELLGIVTKTYGLSKVLKEALAPFLAGCKVVFIYGAIANQTDIATTHVNLLLVGDELDLFELIAALEVSEQKLGRAIHLTKYTCADFESRYVDKDTRLEEILQQPKIHLNDVDNLDRTAIQQE